MRKKAFIGILAGGALSLVTAFGAITYQDVYAQASTPTPNTPAAPSMVGQPGFDRGMHAGGYSEQDLATALGVSLETLQAAEKTAMDEALKQAVTEGLITQSQADQITQNMPSGHFFDGLPFLKGSDIDYNALLAKALGISTDQLQAGYQKAYDTAIDNALANGQITQQQADLAKGSYALSNSSKFQQAMQAAFEAAVKTAVQDGLISQAQADQILQNMTGMRWGGFGGMGFGGPGGHGGHGPRDGFGPGGFGGGQTAPATPNQTAPTAAPSSFRGL